MNGSLDFNKFNNNCLNNDNNKEAYNGNNVFYGDTHMGSGICNSDVGGGHDKFGRDDCGATVKSDAKQVCYDWIENGNDVDCYDEDLKMFNKFAECKCCERHMKDRPLNMVNGWKSEMCNNTQMYYDCRCSCRHNMRFLARIYNFDKVFDAGIVRKNVRRNYMFEVGGGAGDIDKDVSGCFW